MKLNKVVIFVTPSTRMRLVSNKHFVVLLVTLLVRNCSVTGATDGKTHPNCSVSGATDGKTHPNYSVTGATGGKTHPNCSVSGATDGKTHPNCSVTGTTDGKTHPNCSITGATDGKTHPNFSVTGTTDGKTHPPRPLVTMTSISLICDKSVTTRHLTFSSYWCRNICRCTF